MLGEGRALHLHDGDALESLHSGWAPAIGPHAVTQLAVLALRAWGREAGKQRAMALGGRVDPSYHVRVWGGGEVRARGGEEEDEGTYLAKGVECASVADTQGVVISTRHLAHATGDAAHEGGCGCHLRVTCTTLRHHEKYESSIKPIEDREVVWRVGG